MYYWFTYVNDERSCQHGENVTYCLHNHSKTLGTYTSITNNLFVQRSDSPAATEPSGHSPSSLQTCFRLHRRPPPTTHCDVTVSPRWPKLLQAQWTPTLPQRLFVIFRSMQGDNWLRLWLDYPQCDRSIVRRVRTVSRCTPCR